MQSYALERNKFNLLISPSRKHEVSIKLSRLYFKHWTMITFFLNSNFRKCHRGAISSYRRSVSDRKWPSSQNRAYRVPISLSCWRSCCDNFCHPTNTEPVQSMELWVREHIVFIHVPAWGILNVSVPKTGLNAQWLPDHQAS